jgi:hypothetical protein
MPNVLRRFVRDLEALAQYLLLLKQLCCPQCGAVGTLNRHSKLFGNDPDRPDGRSLRGQRVWCSNRGVRGGCGNSFSIVLDEVLPRHSVTATLVWQWLLQLLAGSSLQAAVEALRPPFALETFYRLRRQLRQRLDSLRATLCGEQAPPASAQADPFLHTLEHLQSVFARAECPLAAFQAQFQLPFLG